MNIKKQLLILERRIARKVSLSWLEYVSYRITTGRTLHLKHPRYLDEKLMWINHYDNNPLKSVCADKYRVHEYLKKKGLDQYTVPLLAQYEHPEDINYAELPNAFVLKCNHGCGFNIFVKNKTDIDTSAIGDTLTNWLSICYGGGAGAPLLLDTTMYNSRILFGGTIARFSGL